MIVMRSLKGWTCPKELHGIQIEGSFKSHQIPVPNPRTDDEDFRALEGWLHEYHVTDHIDPTTGKPSSDILSILPPKERRMG